MIALGMMVTCCGIVGLGCVVWSRTSLRALGWQTQGLLHAVHHRALDPVPLTMKFIFALMMSMVTVRTRSLWPSAVAHTLLWAIAGNS